MKKSDEFVGQVERQRNRRRFGGMAGRTRLTVCTPHAQFAS
jgi:hypothetical protein